VSITTLTAHGGRVDWSPDGAWIYFDRLELDGFWDVYRVHPDGSSEKCLTCDAPRLPNKNQGQPAAHPSGRYLLFEAEKARHAGEAGQWGTHPGGGFYSDLWVLDLESGDSHQLTDVRSTIPAGGSLHAHFSHDGTRLLWGDYEGPGGRFGDWRLAVADFVPTPAPHLENRQYYNPGPQPMWMESHGWGPDESWIYFTCTPVAGMHDNDMDICRMDLENPADVTRLTLTSGLNGESGEWDEHAHLSPAGDVFSWMSSVPHSTEAGEDYRRWLRTEL
jgi:Tol biopolymer transport system component